MTIKELQDKVDKWIQDFGVRYFSELTNMAILTEETGELARLIAREYGDQSFKENKKPESVKSEIADELADILFVLSCLANQLDIDLNDAINRNLIKKSMRDSQRHQDNMKLQ